MDLTLEENQNEDLEICAKCMNLTIGDCENWFIEKGYRTVIVDCEVDKLVWDR